MRTILVGLIALAVLACSAGAPTPTRQGQPPRPATATRMVEVPTPILTPPPIAVVRSKVEATFSEPLSSGLSVADVTENALPSVALISTSSGSGTGFVINENGLVVTNKHVVEGHMRVSVRMATGSEYQGSVAKRHPTIDLAYISIDAQQTFTPIAIGDSDEVRVGDEVIVIGFPLGSTLGSEPTVSRGIISAKRDGSLQTDAALNPGNSGGPLLNMFGQVVGVVVSRVEEDSGRPISGIGFAIPVNELKAELGEQVSPAGAVLPTPVPTPFPAIGPPPDIEATKRAIDAIDSHRRAVDQATRTAIEAEEETKSYAASLEATRVAELPTPTATATPTVTPTAIPTQTPEPPPTPTPTLVPPPPPTPHPRTFCEEWEALVLEWLKQGHHYGRDRADRPDHPQLSAEDGDSYCLISFPMGVLSHKVSGYASWPKVGYGNGNLLPGLYEYRRPGDNRVEGGSCFIRLNSGEDNATRVEVPYGEPFTFSFFTYHKRVDFIGNYSCEGSLYRVGDSQ